MNFQAKLRICAEFSRFDFKFSLEFKVISWVLRIFVSLSLLTFFSRGLITHSIVHVVDEKKFWMRKNLLAVLGIFVCTSVPLLNMFQFESFDLQFLLTLLFLAALQIANLDTFKLLKQRISNDDDYFESVMRVELFYLKLVRAITFTMLVLDGCSIPTFAITNMFLFQLPFEK